MLDSLHDAVPLGRDSMINPTGLAIVPSLITAHTDASNPSVTRNTGFTRPIAMPMKRYYVSYNTTIIS